MSESIRGKFLIAGKGLKDPNFLQSAVLMIEHTEAGALGVVVNRPTEIAVSDALSEHVDWPATSDRLFVGGPVEPSALFVLHDAQHLDVDESPVAPGVFVGSTPDLLERLIETLKSNDPAPKYRIICGCAGWGPGQLEGELKRGDWLLQPADGPHIFDREPHAMWEVLLRAAQGAHRILPDYKGDPELN